MTRQETLFGSNNPTDPGDPYPRTSGINLPLDPKYWKDPQIAEAAGLMGENSFDGYTSEEYEELYRKLRDNARNSNP